MKAVAVQPGAPASAKVIETPEPPCGPGEVMVRTLECGLCATDCEIDAGRAGEAPGDFLILGHEVLGRVAVTGSGVIGFVPGDLVVATVRRPCGCANCAASESDMCTSGRAAERGIKGRHGFLSEYFVDEPAFLVRVPRALRPVAVLTAPLAIAEKAVHQVQSIQRRMRWEPERALVLGSDTIALLLAMLLRLARLDVLVVSDGPADGLAARVCRDLGAGFAARAGLPGLSGPFDIVIDRTRDAAWAAAALAPGGVLCCIGRPVHAAVHGNQVAFASASAHRRDYERAVQHLSEFEARWPGLCSRLITRRLPMDAVRQALAPAPEHIKTVISLL